MIKDFLSKIFFSFYNKKFYAGAINNKNSSYFSIIIAILFITYLVPSAFIYYKLSNFSFKTTQSEQIKSFAQDLEKMPDFSIKEGILNIEEPITVSNIIAADKETNSPDSLNTLILFANEGIYFKEYQILKFLLQNMGIKKLQLGNLENSVNYIEYPKDEEIKITGIFLLDLVTGYTKTLSKKILFPFFPITIALLTLFKFIEISILAFLTAFIAKRNNIKLSKLQIKQLTILALIPALTIKMLNGIFLFSSSLLALPIAGIILFAMKIAYINFAVRSVKNES